MGMMMGAKGCKVSVGDIMGVLVSQVPWVQLLPAGCLLSIHGPAGQDNALSVKTYKAFPANLSIQNQLAFSYL